MEDGIHSKAYGHYSLKKLKGARAREWYFLDIIVRERMNVPELSSSTTTPYMSIERHPFHFTVVSTNVDQFLQYNSILCYRYCMCSLCVVKNSMNMFKFLLSVADYR